MSFNHFKYYVTLQEHSRGYIQDHYDIGSENSKYNDFFQLFYARIYCIFLVLSVSQTCWGNRYIFKNSLYV